MKKTDRKIPPTLPPEELAKYIKQLSRAAQDVTHNSHLTKRAMIVLIHDAMPSSKRPPLKTVALVFDSMALLCETYCK